MSNARSPRDVCSTTIGTRGLIGCVSIASTRARHSGAKGKARSDLCWAPACARDLMAKPDHSNEILTVGHSNHEEGEFLDLVRGGGIELIADVRRYPGSRRQPHFERTAPAARLLSAWVGSRWG